jgi:ubiquitin carboxyl-terminal hydrolase 25/28
VKTSENADTYWFQKVHKAVELIANHRNSAALRRYLATGEATTTDEDELAAAYRFYNISDRTSSIDVEALGLQLQLLIDDNDESKDRKARATKYFELLKANTKSTPPVVMAPDYNKPVGLENLHNFCYLHSLLQFFFAILVFRETILNFDDFKQAIEELVDTDLGKIGGEAVTKSRVEDGYKLVQQLHELFTRLHQAPGPSIQVATDLAAGALQAPPAEAKLVPATVIETAAAESSPESETVRGDESSDITLIGDAIMTPESETDEQQTTDAGNTEQTSAGGNDDSKKDDNDKSGPPNRPPPVPPRPKKPDEIADLYAQHDAYQVLSNVIQKTMASIAPTSIDSKGERHDRIRDLFYGVTQQLCTTNSKRHEAFDLSYNTHQFIYLAAKPKDVQEGLDIDFGREELETGEWERYKVMTEAPPMLQLYIQNRVDVSGESGFKSERIDHNMELNETIQLDRYMKENQEQMLPLRTKSWDLRDRLNELTGDGKKHKIKLGGKQDPAVELDSDESFTALIAALKSDREDNLLDEKTEELIQQLNGAAESDFHVKADREKEIPELRAKLNAIDLSICDTKDLRYRIFAIFM